MPSELENLPNRIRRNRSVLEPGTVITSDAPFVAPPKFGSPDRHELRLQYEIVCNYPVHRYCCSCGWIGQWIHRRKVLKLKGAKCGSLAVKSAGRETFDHKRKAAGDQE